MAYANVEDLRAAQARWRERHRDRHAAQTRAAKLRSKYGLSIEDFERIAAIQGDRCALCRTDTPGGRGSWHVDHDHETGAIRGLLCMRCNRAIGMFEDSTDLLELAIRYLRESQTAPAHTRGPSGT